MPCNCFNFSEVSRLHISGRLQHSALGVMMGLRKLNRRLATVAMGHNGQFEAASKWNSDERRRYDSCATLVMLISCGDGDFQPLILMCSTCLQATAPASISSPTAWRKKTRTQCDCSHLKKTPTNLYNFRQWLKIKQENARTAQCIDSTPYVYRKLWQAQLYCLYNIRRREYSIFLRRNA